MAKIKSLTDKELTELQAKGSVTLLGHEIKLAEVMLKYDVSGGEATFEAHSENNVCIGASTLVIVVLVALNNIDVIFLN